MFLGRVADLREDGACEIGLKKYASVALLGYDLFLNVFVSSTQPSFLSRPALDLTQSSPWFFTLTVDRTLRIPYLEVEVRQQEAPNGCDPNGESNRRFPRMQRR